MRRLTVVVGLVVVFITAILLATGISSHLPSSLDARTATASYIWAFGTHAHRVLGTPKQLLGLPEINIAVASTRTAIALTRNPSLAISTTPDGLRQTLTAIVSEINPLDQTVTAIVAQSTATQQAILGTLAPTLTPPNPCEVWQFSREQDLTLSSGIQNGLLEAGIQNTSVVTIIDGVTHSGCGDSFYPLETTIHLLVIVYDINMVNHNYRLANLTEEILVTLVHIAPAREYGLESARLSMTFYVSDIPRLFIITGYANALTAYEEGLRGEALLEALGGILPA